MERKNDIQDKTAKKVAGGKPAEALSKTRKPGQASHQKRTRTGPAGQAGEWKRQLKIQKALYEIADAASAVKDMQSFYKKLHRIVGKLMYADNFFIALYDPQTDLITWPYNVDMVDVVPQPPPKLSDFRGATGWVLRHGKTLAVVDGSWAEAISRGEMQPVGAKSNGIAVPLRIERQTIGVLMVQSYSDEIGYQLEDVKVLEFVAHHISTALSRARAIEETRQRNAELAIINSVQEGLAKQLDLQGIIDLIGEKVGEIFHADTTVVALYDAERDWSYKSYYMDHGKRTYFPDGPALRPSLGAVVIDSRRPLLLGTAQESEKLGALRIASADAEVDRNESYLGVPILAGEKVIGLLAVQSYKQYAYTSSDLRLLQTLANSMSVALENARLFDETQRLLKETEERNVELAIINSVQQGLASKLEIRAIYELIGEKVREIFQADTTYINTYNQAEQSVYSQYYADKGQQIIRTEPLPLGEGLYSRVIQERQPIRAGTREEQLALGVTPAASPDSEQDLNQSYLGVPILLGDEVTGVVSIQSYTKNAYSDSDMRLLQTLANSMSVALENARLFDESQRLLKETEERNAELAVINSIQQGLAAKVQIESIYELVGDKLREIFSGSHVVWIYTIDPVKKEFTFHYAIEKGIHHDLGIDHYAGKPYEAFHDRMAKMREVLVINENFDAFAKENGLLPIRGTKDPKSMVVVPLQLEERIIGHINLANIEREHAFGETEVRLLTTIANSMSVALENARLFDEIHKANTEIKEALERETASNDILRVMAESPTDIQPVLEVIARNAAQLSGSEDAIITLRDSDMLRVDAHYGDLPTFAVGEGMRFNRESVAGRAILEGRSLQAVHNQPGARPEYPEGDKAAKKYGYRVTCAVPLMREGKAIGAISIRRTKPELLADKQISLIQSFANQAAIAVENVRLFKETTRLLQETEQRAAELTIINSVQQGLASKLEMQAIYELVGDKISQITGSEIVVINTWNKQAETVRYEYIREKGERLGVFERPFSPLNQMILPELENGKTIIWNEGMQERLRRLGHSLPAGEMPLSVLIVPLQGNEVQTSISLQDTRREQAFDDSTIRLVETLAGSMSVALENARLFNETQRLLKETEERNAELAIINSVQQGLASKLEFQGIIDLVGDKLREIFDAQSINITRYDAEHDLFSSLYMVERGVRISYESMQPGPIYRRILDLRESLLFRTVEEFNAIDAVTVPGTETSKSGIYVPLLVGEAFLGVIALENIDRENAFSESDLRLLTTLTNSMSVALENARLFNETQRLLVETEERNAELAVINRVQQGLASKLEFQSIINLIGDKLGEIFDAQATLISLYYPGKEEIDHRYLMERGRRLNISRRIPVDKFRRRVVETRQPWVINQDYQKITIDIGEEPVLEGEEPKSLVFVPMIVGKEVTGIISLQNLDSENAFSDSDVRLLTTIAASMSVALENARLFEETQRLLKETEQRAGELSAISAVSQALVAETELDAMIELIGNQMREIFAADIVYVALLDQQTNLIHFPYQFGETFDTLKFGEGLTSKIIQSGEPLLITKDIETRRKELGASLVGKEALSYLGVPVHSGKETIGVLSVQSTTEEGVFDEDDLRLLATIAANAGAAIQTAKLHAETKRRAREMAILAEIGNEIAASRELKPVLERIAAHAKDILAVRDIAIILREPDSQTFRTSVVLGRYAEQLMKVEIAPGRGLVGHILQSGMAEFVNDPASDPRVMHIPGTPVEEEHEEFLMGAPLVSRGQIVGGIMVWRSRVEGIFTQTDLDFLVSVARQTAIAIESARLYLETQRQAREMSALVEVGRNISASLEAETVLESIATHARDLLGGDLSALFLPESDGSTFRAIAAVGKEAEYLRNDTISLGEGILGSIALNKTGEIVNDVNKDQRAITIAGTKINEDEHLLAVPLLANEELKGLMSVWRSGKGKEFVDTELEFLLGLSRQAVIAIQNTQLFTEAQRLLKETEQRAAELAIINSVQEGLASQLELQAIYDLVGDKIQDIFEAQVVGIYDFDHPSGTIYYPYYREKDKRLQHEPRAFTPTAKYLIRTGRLFLINQDFEKRMEELGLNITPLPDATNPKSVVYAPLLSGGIVIGAIGLKNVDRENAFSESDVRLLQTLANSMSVALESARLFSEIESQRQYLEAIITNSPVAIITADLNGKVVSWNPAAETLFGYTPAEAIGRDTNDLIALSDEIRAEALACSMQTRKGELFHSITRRNRKDGTLVDVDMSVVPVSIEKESMGIVGIYHNITELQRARQEAVAANEAKSSFLATMSHEIRTPMNAVIGMSGLLMDTPLNKEQRDYAETIRNSSDALLAIINDILDFSKIEAGRMDMEQQPFNLRECVESALDLVAARAVEKNIDLAYLIEDDVPAGIYGDVTRLRQVLLNLLSNAVKFTEQGEVVLTVTGSKSGENELQFSVRDTGIGIPEERIGQLFESFTQIDSSTTRKYGGTGLGLAISKRLAEMMGGRLWVESGGKDQGSTFSFTIQAKPARVTGRRQRNLEEIWPALEGKRVLIVDDNQTNRRILAMQSRKWGLQPRETKSARQALRWLRQGESFDLAIFDLQMPEMDGIHLAREVRKLAGGRALPIVLLTSLGRREAGIEDLDIAAYLTKPLKPSALFDALAGIFVQQNVVAPEANSGKHALDPEMARQHPLRILLAEDNQVNQKLAIRLLEQMGYRADVASNGLEAIESVKRQPYDVILMDVQMPEMDGLEATRAIRKLDIRQPYIVAMTANAMQGDREMCLAAGMEFYVSKPIRVPELVAVLKLVKTDGRR